MFSWVPGAHQAQSRMRPTMTSHTRNGALLLLLRPNPIKGNYPRVGSPLPPVASSPIQSGSTHHPAAKQNAIRPSGISFRGRGRKEAKANGPHRRKNGRMNAQPSERVAPLQQESGHAPSLERASEAATATPTPGEEQRADRQTSGRTLELRRMDTKEMGIEASGSIE